MTGGALVSSVIPEPSLEHLLTITFTESVQSHRSHSVILLGNNCEGVRYDNAQFAAKPLAGHAELCKITETVKVAG
jgi:hypothetical protein